MNTAKAVIWGHCIALKAHIRKQERSEINNLSFHLKLEKELNKSSRRKETATINEIGNRRKNREKSMKPKTASLQRSVKFVNF